MAIIPASFRQGAARFLRWWGAELWACLPAELRETARRGRQRLVVEITESKATFSEARGKHLKRLGAVTLESGKSGDGAAAGNEGADAQRAMVARIIDNAGMRSAQVALRLPRGQVLRRVVDLPAAAAENLREVLGFEMDRHTPFKAQEVYYDYRVKEVDPQRKRLKVDLVVIPRGVVDRMVRIAEAWGLDLDVVEVTGGDSG
ncbi:MAG: hypothetical protein D6826_09855, partial [Alphaproteobacteria bacterium]